MAGTIDNYWNRFDESKGYVELLMRDGYGAQASEINEIQSIFSTRVGNLAKALFTDGDIISGGQIVVDVESGHVTAEAGMVYLNGAVWAVPAAAFDIPVTGTVAVGVTLTESVISELEDPGLRNPAIGSRAEGEPGAWRRKVTAAWAADSADLTDVQFYPVYEVQDGVQAPKEAPPNLDSFTAALARYDRDSTGTGTYAVNGLEVVAGEDLADGRQLYHLSEGRARVDGMGVELPTSCRIVYAAEPDLRTIDTEVHTATSDSTNGGQRIDVAHTPLKDVTTLRITVERTAQMVHGAYSGATDDLPDTSITRIVSVSQGDTTYAETTDYIRSGDRINWSPAGAEPAPGSTYQVVYQCMVAATPEQQDLDGFTVSEAVAGTSILVSYTQMLPRYDRLAMSSTGGLTWFKGIAAEANPQMPAVPENMLLLATVYQSWRDSTRAVTSDGVRVVPFDEITRINKRLDYVLSEIARQRLEADVYTRESGARVGLFVDPLLDDSMRDQGISQTAAIIEGDLTLPVTDVVSATMPGDVTDPAARPYTVQVVLEQPYRTGEMLVNPYRAFDPLPAKIKLTPAIDQWTESRTIWTSAVTQIFGSGNRSSSTTTTQTVSVTTTNLAYLRQIKVAFTVEGFGPGEILDAVTFDGIDVTASVEA